MKCDSKLSGILHVILYMAEAKGSTTSEDLAKAMRTNAVVIRRIMAGLREGGIVRSIKGHGGGWVIVRDLSDVTLRDVYAAIGSPRILAIGHRSEAPTCLVEQALNAAMDDAFASVEAPLLARLGRRDARRPRRRLPHPHGRTGGSLSILRTTPMQHDVIIVGGSFAGLAAATYLARGRRRVLVVDAGAPRNRFAAASHGFIGRDGMAPHAILAEAREQLLAYPTVELVAGEAVAVTGVDGDFTIRLRDGSTHKAAKLLLAFGLVDTVPDLPGMAERWGASVLHCPYCHGIEFSDRPLGVLHKGPMSVHQAMLIREWGPTTLFLNGASLEPEAAEELASRRISVEPVPVAGLEGAGTDLAAVRLANGRAVRIEALYVTPTSRLGSPLALALGCAVEEETTGQMLHTGPDNITTVPGVHAAGDIACAIHSISRAVADGAAAGAAVHHALVFPTPAA